MTDSHNDTIEIEPRPVGEVARRVALLVTLVRRAAIEAPAEAMDESDAFMRETDRFDLYSWARRELAGDMTDDERVLLQASTGELDEEDLDECLLAAVPATALGWSLRAIERLAPTDAPDTNSDTLLDWAPEPWAEISKWSRRLTLRSEDVLASERERWELWHWRATLSPDELEPGEDLHAVVADVAREAADAGLVDTVEGDFAVANRPFASLPTDEQEAIATLAESYLLALNWVCGFGASWSDTPLYPD